jgi:GT2 family glycosyltransferase
MKTTAGAVECQQPTLTSAINHPKISVITVGYNSLSDLKRCLPFFTSQSYPNFEIIVIDNGSQDGTTAYLSEHFPNIKLYSAEENLGFSGGNNWAAHLADGEYLAFINPDTTVELDWLDGLVEALQLPNVGIATSKILLMAQPDRMAHLSAAAAGASALRSRGMGLCNHARRGAHARQAEKLHLAGAQSGSDFEGAAARSEPAAGQRPRDFALRFLPSGI